MRRVYISLPDPAVEALRKLADRETRPAKHQATRLILDGLRREGLLAAEGKTLATGQQSGDPDR